MFPQPLSDFEQPTLSALEFDIMLESAQPRLRGYVASILGAWSDVDDLVQETNLVLIQKRHNFEAGTNFIAWSFRVAYFKATTWRRDRMREGRVVLSEAAFQEIAAHAETHFEDRQPELGHGPAIGTRRGTRHAAPAAGGAQPHGVAAASRRRP